MNTILNIQFESLKNYELKGKKKYKISSLLIYQNTWSYNLEFLNIMYIINDI